MLTNQRIYRALPAILKQYGEDATRSHLLTLANANGTELFAPTPPELEAARIQQVMVLRSAGLQGGAAAVYPVDVGVINLTAVDTLDGACVIVSLTAQAALALAQNIVEIIGGFQNVTQHEERPASESEVSAG